MSSMGEDSIPKRKTFIKRVGQSLYDFVKTFNDIDTSYIEPQHYNFTVMLQNTNTYEVFNLRSKEGSSITFAPEPSYKVGPYLGWRWLVLGYTFDVKRLFVGGKAKQEFDLSIYTSAVGIDLFYRKTGNDYKIRSLTQKEDNDIKEIRGIPFDGLSASVKGFNIYYIFNRKKLSYPAAFSQSTRQKISCGSPIIGIGYSKHTLSVDWDKLQNIIDERSGGTVELDKNMLFGNLKYSDISVSGGYAYNWVFARNLLFASSLSLALGYKSSSGDLAESEGFSFGNFNIDGVGRFGLVWNNNRWYMGASAIVHSYNYGRKQFSTSNVFGSLNIYIGFNFGKK